MRRAARIVVSVSASVTAASVAALVAPSAFAEPTYVATYQIQQLSSKPSCAVTATADCTTFSTITASAMVPRCIKPEALSADVRIYEDYSEVTLYSAALTSACKNRRLRLVTVSAVVPDAALLHPIG